MFEAGKLVAANKKITWWQKKHTFDTNKIKQRAIGKQTQKNSKNVGENCS